MAALQFVYNCLSGWAVDWGRVGDICSMNEMDGVNKFQAVYRRRIRQPEKVEWGLNGNRASVCANRF